LDAQAGAERERTVSCTLQALIFLPRNGELILDDYKHRYARSARPSGNHRQGRKRIYAKGGGDARYRALILSKILNVSIVQPLSKPVAAYIPKNLGKPAYWEDHADERIYSRTTVGEVSGLGTARS
jgi:hypothetical protein